MVILELSGFRRRLDKPEARDQLLGETPPVNQSVFVGRESLQSDLRWLTASW